MAQGQLFQNVLSVEVGEELEVVLSEVEGALDEISVSEVKETDYSDRIRSLDEKTLAASKNRMVA